MIVSFFFVYSCGIQVFRFLRAKLFSPNNGLFFSEEPTISEEESDLNFPLAIDGSSYVDDKGDIRFAPPVYSQRYMAVSDELETRGPFRKVVELGCNALALFPFLKHCQGLEEAVLVDIDRQLLFARRFAVTPLTSDHLRRRESPFRVRLLAGNAAVPDISLASADAVVAIELIEHMFPPDLNELPYCIFGVVQPRLAVFTTPNADFNILFKHTRLFRDPDHKFEWTRQQFYDWAKNITLQYPEYSVTLKGVGVGPEGSHRYGTCSQMAVFVRNSPPNCDLSLFKENAYELIEDVSYPCEPHTEPTPEEKILYYLRKFFTYEEKIEQYYSHREGRVTVPLSEIFRFLIIITDNTDLIRQVLQDNGYMIEESTVGEEVVIPPPEESSSSAGGDSYDGRESEEVLFLERGTPSDSDAEVWGLESSLSPFQSDFIASTPLSQPAAGDVFPSKDIYSLSPTREFLIDLQALSGGDKSNDAFIEPIFLGPCGRIRRGQREYGEGPSGGDRTLRRNPALQEEEGMDDEETPWKSLERNLVGLFEEPSINVDSIFDPSCMDGGIDSRKLGCLESEVLTLGEEKNASVLESRCSFGSLSQVTSCNSPESEEMNPRFREISKTPGNLPWKTRNCSVRKHDEECENDSLKKTSNLQREKYWKPGNFTCGWNKSPDICESWRKATHAGDVDIDEADPVIGELISQELEGPENQGATEAPAVLDSSNAVNICCNPDESNNLDGTGRHCDTLNTSFTEPSLCVRLETSSHITLEKLAGDVCSEKDNASGITKQRDIGNNNERLTDTSAGPLMLGNCSKDESEVGYTIPSDEIIISSHSFEEHVLKVDPASDLFSDKSALENYSIKAKVPATDHANHESQETKYHKTDLELLQLNNEKTSTSLADKVFDATVSSSEHSIKNSFNNNSKNIIDDTFIGLPKSVESIHISSSVKDLRPVEGCSHKLDDIYNKDIKVNDLDDTFDPRNSSPYPLLASNKASVSIVSSVNSLSEQNEQFVDQSCDIKLKVISSDTGCNLGGCDFVNSICKLDSPNVIVKQIVDFERESLTADSSKSKLLVSCEEGNVVDNLVDRETVKCSTFQESEPILLETMNQNIHKEVPCDNIHSSHTQINSSSHCRSTSRESLLEGSDISISKKNNSLPVPFNLSQSCDSAILCEQLSHNIEASQSEDNIVYKNVATEVNLCDPKINVSCDQSTPLKSYLQLSINGNYEMEPATHEKVADKGVIIVSKDQTPVNLNMLDFAIKEKGEDHTSVINRCKSLQLIRDNVEKQANRFSLCCEKDERSENRLYGMGWSLEEVGGSWREETEGITVDDSRSQSRAADSGYPNTSDRDPDMDTDLTPEQVDELLSENESSFDEREEEEEEPPVERPLPAGIAAPVQFIEHVENGDVANNNQDDEGNNMDGEGILAFDLVQIQANDDRQGAPARHDSDSEDENKYVSASESLLSETVVVDEESKEDMDEALDTDIWGSTPGHDWSQASSNCTLGWADPQTTAEVTCNSKKDTHQAGPSEWQIQTLNELKEPLNKPDSCNAESTNRESNLPEMSEQKKEAEPGQSSSTSHIALEKSSENHLFFNCTNSFESGNLQEIHEPSYANGEENIRMSSGPSNTISSRRTIALEAGKYQSEPLEEFGGSEESSGTQESAQIMQRGVDPWDGVTSSSSLIAYASSSSSLSPQDNQSLVLRTVPSNDFPLWLRNIFADDLDAMGDTRTAPATNDVSSDFLLLPEDPSQGSAADIMGGGEPHFQS